MAPLEGAWKTGQKNGMVWYVSIKNFKNIYIKINNRKFIKSEKSAESAK